MNGDELILPRRHAQTSNFRNRHAFPHILELDTVQFVDSVFRYYQDTVRGFVKSTSFNALLMVRY